MISGAAAQAGEALATASLRALTRLTETLVLLLQEETLDALGRVAALVSQIEYAVTALAAVRPSRRSRPRRSRRAPR